MMLTLPNADQFKYLLTLGERRLVAKINLLQLLMTISLLGGLVLMLLTLPNADQSIFLFRMEGRRQFAETKWVRLPSGDLDKGSGALCGTTSNHPHRYHQCHQCRLQERLI